MKDMTLPERYARLQALKKQVDSDLAATERGLRATGLMSVRGPAPLAPTHTVAEAREAHKRHRRGDRDEWVKAGERQYQRESKRARRQDGAA